ncbi:MAG: dTMP kinase [Myxococcota bacterium]
MNPGRLVALEGLDGCGKTTQLPHVVRALEQAGHDVLATREPTEGEWGRKIRVTAQTGDLAPPEEELRWFMEDRAEHLHAEVLPALAAGRTVVTDRYFLSTVAYQGARGLDWREILRENEERFRVPDLALLYVVEPSLGMQRVRDRGTAVEPGFEQEEFLARVAEIFAAVDRPWIARIDGGGSEEAVRRETLEHLEPLLAETP